MKTLWLASQSLYIHKTWIKHLTVYQIYLAPEFVCIPNSLYRN